MTSSNSEPAARGGKQPGTTPRRKFQSALEWAIRGFLILWLAAVFGIVTAYITPPRGPLRAADWQLDGGAADSFEIGQPRMIQGGPEPVWLARLDEDTFAALAAVCEHQHCVLRWNSALGVFSCPCHHGTYDLDGRSLAGPSREPLRSFFVNIKAGRVRVHLRRVIGDEA